MPSSKSNSGSYASEVADVLASQDSTSVTTDAILAIIGEAPGDRYVDISSDMSVRAKIKTDQQRVIDYFLSPLKIYVSKSLSER